MDKTQKDYDGEVAEKESIPLRSKDPQVEGSSPAALLPFAARKPFVVRVGGRGAVLCTIAFISFPSLYPLDASINPVGCDYQKCLQNNKFKKLLNE